MAAAMETAGVREEKETKKVSAILHRSPVPLRALSIVAIALVLSGCGDMTMRSVVMIPTITNGETIVGDYSAFAFHGPRRWDVVAFRPLGITNAVFVMRVVALPGETVQLQQSNVTINGQKQTPPSRLSYLSYAAFGRYAVTSAFSVPKDCYFVLGDNTVAAADSRFCGAIPRTNIIAKIKGR